MARNTGWLIFDKVFHMFLSLLVTGTISRYLGVEKYGILNYGLAFLEVFTVITKLGIDGILVNEVSKYKGIEAPSMPYEASGSALENGISLHKLYLGTGHDEKLRLPLDYGSDMFLIKEKDNESGQKE